MRLSPIRLAQLIDNALAEDLGLGDVTTDTTVPDDAWAEARLLAKQDLVLCGMPVAKAVFERVDPRIEWRPDPEFGVEGTRVPMGQVIGTVAGPANGVLTAERLALNLLQRMSGVATLTRQFVDALEGTGVRVSDTRKTIPGLRMLDKYAVVTGGGANHRWALDGGVLIKDNHLQVAGSVTAAVQSARAGAPHTLRVEVECKHLYQVREALGSGADAVLLDNMDVDTLRRAIDMVGGALFVEVSGGITLDTVRSRALAGVDLISTGSLTHSARAVDISLDIQCVRGPVHGWLVERWAELESTNDRARQWGDSGGAGPFAVLAESQTHGRGRLGRSWVAPHGGHLSLSALVRPDVAPSHAPRLSLVAGLATIQALAASFPSLQDRIELKWPNDVLLDGKKLAGMLAEMSTHAGALDYVVLGIGLNANVEPDEWSAELRQRATSLEAALGYPVDRERFLRELLGSLYDLVADFASRGGALDVEALSRWCRKGRALRYERAARAGSTEAGEFVVGTVDGVMADGALCLVVGDRREIIHSGDVLPVEWLE